MSEEKQEHFGTEREIQMMKAIICTLHKMRSVNDDSIAIVKKSTDNLDKLAKLQSDGVITKDDIDALIALNYADMMESMHNHLLDHMKGIEPADILNPQALTKREPSEPSEPNGVHGMTNGSFTIVR